MLMDDWSGGTLKRSKQGDHSKAIHARASCLKTALTGTVTGSLLRNGLHATAPQRATQLRRWTRQDSWDY
jgi:hypothetical protein